MIDLSKLKKGDTVKFRNGGKSVVKHTEKQGAYVCLTLDGSTHGRLLWLTNGRFDEETSETDPFDIIAIEPAPFDWAEVQPGMAFLHEGFNNSRAIYVGPSIVDSSYAVVLHHGQYTAAPKSELSRAPHNDIKAPL